MARTYWMRGETTVSESYPLDAHLARKLLQGNAEAVYEEARHDYCVVLPYDLGDEEGDLVGPFQVELRRDRDGRWRPPLIDVLAAGGDTSRTLYAYLVERWGEPNKGIDPYAAFTVPSGTTLDWIGEEEIALPSSYDPQRHRWPEGDEIGELRFAWLCFQWDTITSGGPYFGGFRVIEQVDVS